jgi:septation ring formation regulator EzrA
METQSWLRTAAFTAAAACVCVLALSWCADRRMRENAAAAAWNVRAATYDLAAASRNLKEISAALADPRTGLARTLRNVNTVTAQAGRASNVARLASAEQRVQLRAIGNQTEETLRAANRLIARADRNVNQGTLPALTEDLRQLHNSIAALTDDGREMIASTTATIDNAGALLADPAIGAAAKNLASASGHVDGTAANAEQATGYVRDLLKPAKRSFWKTFALRFAAPVITRLIPQNVVVTNK